MLKTSHLIAFAAGAVLAAAAGGAQAAVTVLGGGMAQACSKAALGGESDSKSEDMCTLALDTELLSLRDRAGTYVNRGVLKLRRREFNAAQFDFNRAVQTKPDLGEAYVNRGAASVGARRFAEEVAAGSAEKETELRERLSLAPPGSQPPPALAQPSPDRPDQRVITDAVQ